MPNLIRNQLGVAAPTSDILFSLIEEIEDAPIFNLEETVARAGDFFACICTFDSSWIPPIEAYGTLEALTKELDGVTVDATWFDENDEWDTKYRWLFSNLKYQVVETGLWLGPGIVTCESGHGTRQFVETFKNFYDRIGDIKVAGKLATEILSQMDKFDCPVLIPNHDCPVIITNVDQPQTPH